MYPDVNAAGEISSTLPGEPIGSCSFQCAKAKCADGAAKPAAGALGGGVCVDAWVVGCVGAPVDARVGDWVLRGGDAGAEVRAAGPFDVIRGVARGVATSVDRRLLDAVVFGGCTLARAFGAAAGTVDASAGAVEWRGTATRAAADIVKAAALGVRVGVVMAGRAGRAAGLAGAE